MENQITSASRIYLLFVAVLGWFALISQFYINMSSGIASTPELLIRYFSYFTLLTNLLVAVCCTSILMAPNDTLSVFFRRPQTLTAITVYILIVGIIYNLILRFIWKPEGLQLIVDELLHSIIPLLFLIFWSLFVSKSQLNWIDVFPWLIYPLIYVVFIFIRGSFSGFYPYPFINVGLIGFEKAMMNAVGIAFAFLLISLLFIFLAKAISKNKLRTQNPAKR